MREPWDFDRDLFSDDWQIKDEGLVMLSTVGWCLFLFLLIFLVRTSYK